MNGLILATVFLWMMASTSSADMGFETRADRVASSCFSLDDDGKVTSWCLTVCEETVRGDEDLPNCPRGIDEELPESEP